ncbi:hypothetical protein KUTeg_017100 [Tegillarca granosa]|uniref:Mitochondrial ribosomal protein S35 n=1 Tax=Tegillarca granosa TaxID=220873 RepID=A0ABQ9ET32_TEGGR|nr:hypothetical protein KUTeg_017100 [Tegillarca granosa]
MNKSEKTNNSMIPRSSVLRVCMSCWSRLPGVFRLSQGITASQITSSRLTCSNICGLKWLKQEIYPQNISSKRFYTSEPKTKTDSVASIESNPYFDKYKEKLKKKESESPEEFRGKLEELQENERERQRQRREDLTTPPSTEQSLDNKSYAADLSGKWPPKSLDEIMKVDLIKDKSPKEIDISHKENAPVCLTVAHFPELKEEKGLVLMAGKYDGNILNKKEALSLVRQMSYYYGQKSKDRFKYVECFNHKPDSFRHEDLIGEYNDMEKSLESEY